MKSAVLLGLALLGCGGGQAAQQGGPGPPAGAGAAQGGQEGQAPQKPAGGQQSGEAGEPGAGAAQGGQDAAGSAGEAPAGTGGQASAGAAQGGQAGQGGDQAGQAGEGQAGENEGGAGGAPEPIDDTGCVERPTSTKTGTPTQVVGFDCSGCTTGADLGYTTPPVCAPAGGCDIISVDVTALGSDDVFILLPAGSEASSCGEQACRGPDGPAVDYPGYVAQVFLNAPANTSVRVDVDDGRRVFKRVAPLTACSQVTTCSGFGGGTQIAVVVRPDAPRGFMRIRLSPIWNCSYQPYPTG